MRVVILERSPPTSAGVGVWISGAFCPTCGTFAKAPTDGARQQRRGQLRRPPRSGPRSATRRRWGSRRWSCRRPWRRRDRSVVVCARKAGWVCEGFDRGREGADRGLVERFLRRFSRSSLPPVRRIRRRFGLSSPAPWRSRAPPRRRRPGCGRARRRRTGSGSRPCRRPAPPGETTSVEGPSAASSTSARVLPLALGKSLFGGAGRLSARVLRGAGRGVRAATAPGQREPPIAEQAGEGGKGSAAGASAACY